MCFFPFANTAHNSIAYKKGVHEFDCGCCPECLSKRARLWALRCSAESQNNIGCMVTLTYDSYKYDKHGNVIGENDPADLHVDKRDCQLFIKRLRKHFDKLGTKVKYLLTAEYGKRTHRAHYHAILFGVQFNDLIKYKRSKRGNWIYKSKTLTDLWNNGICTVDAINISAQVARYCTKYCAKDSRCDDTFMLVSRGIGDKWLLEHFNGKLYVLDGREYPIPKLIWNKKIAEFYRNNYVFNLRNADYKYRSLKWYESKYDGIMANYFADYNSRQRKYFRSFRDSNLQYKTYIEYWSNKAEQYERTRPDVLTRIRQLPNDKYFRYKQACLDVLVQRRQVADIYHASDIILPPRYNSKTRLEKYLAKKYGICPDPLVIKGQMTPTEQEKRFLKLRADFNYLKSWKTDYNSPFYQSKKRI